MSIADACLCELCSLGERILRKQERNSREIPVLPMFRVSRKTQLHPSSLMHIIS